MGYVLLSDPEKYDNQEGHTNDDMQGMQSGHKEIEPEEEGVAPAQFSQDIRAGIEAVVDFMAPFKIFIHQESDSKRHGNRNKDQGGSLILFLYGGSRHGNGHTADQQDKGVDRSHFYIQVLCCQVKGFQVSMAKHRIDDKESAEQQQLGKYKEPHAQFGGDVIPVFFMSYCGS